MIGRIILFTLTFLISVHANAQYYENAAGVRLGGTSGITYKKFMNNDQSLELLLSGRNRGFQTTVLYQFYKPLRLGKFDTFFFYYGPGGHVGIERHSREVVLLSETGPPQLLNEEAMQYVMGMDVVAGVEYRLVSVPLIIGFEVKPYLNFVGMRTLDVDFWDSSLTIKYAF